jgi:hypothetical protein
VWACGQELRKLANSAARDHTGCASLLYAQLPRKADLPACLLLVFLFLCAFALLALMSALILAYNVVYPVFLWEYYIYLFPQAPYLISSVDLSVSH